MSKSVVVCGGKKVLNHKRKDNINGCDKAIRASRY